MLLDLAAWLLLAIGGGAMAVLSPHADDWLERLSPHADPGRLLRWVGRAVAAGVVVHVATWVFGVPWPHRFGATVLLVTATVWLANRPGRTGTWLGAIIGRLLPETHGRSLWGSVARRRLLQRLVAEGDPARLVDGETHLIVSACAVDSGRMCYFVNWADPTPAFRQRVDEGMGEIRLMSRPAEVIEATVASSAVPAIFEPVRIEGRDFVDGGVFSNQPLHVALADGADALLVVLVSPSGAPPRPLREPNAIELGARLIELANWRDLQTELRSLPPGWSRRGVDAGAESAPARVCVVEPETLLPGGMYGFSADSARALMARGQDDAWRALEKAGWLEPAGPPDAAPGRGLEGAAGLR